jgi:hypothetical protein
MGTPLTFRPRTDLDIRGIIMTPNLVDQIKESTGVVVDFIGFHEPMISADGLVALFQLQGQIFSLDQHKKLVFFNANELFQTQLAILMVEFWGPIAQAANQDLIDLKN